MVLVTDGVQEQTSYGPVLKMVNEWLDWYKVREASAQQLERGVLAKMKAAEKVPDSAHGEGLQSELE